MLLLMSGLPDPPLHLQPGPTVSPLAWALRNHRGCFSPLVYDSGNGLSSKKVSASREGRVAVLTRESKWGLAQALQQCTIRNDPQWFCFLCHFAAKAILLLGS